MPRAVLIYNPRAGRWRARGLVDSVVAILRDGGYTLEAVPTAGPGDATRLARAAASAGASVTFVLGGDGTAREVAAGLLGSETALATIPAGTVNILPRALGLPPAARPAATALLAASERQMDVGLCGDQPFLMLVSAGLDARVLERVPPALKRRFGRAAVALTGLSQWWRYGFPEIRLRAGGRVESGSFAAVCNLPFYAGPWCLAPGARIDDHRLDLVVFRGGRADTLAFAADLFRGRHLERSDTRRLLVEEVEIETPPDLAVEVDGDPVPLRPPLLIRVAPERLRVLAGERTTGFGDPS